MRPTSSANCAEEAMKAAGACREASRRFSPPRLLGSDAFRPDHSEQGPPMMSSRHPLMAESKSLVVWGMWPGGQVLRM